MICISDPYIYYYFVLVYGCNTAYVIEKRFQIHYYPPLFSALSAQQDAVFELVSMAFNVAIWYTKYASRLAGKEK